jgi:hypothetical protein
VDVNFPGGDFDDAYCFGSSFGHLDDRGNTEFLRAAAGDVRPGGPLADWWKQGVNRVRIIEEGRPVPAESRR